MFAYVLGAGYPLPLATASTAIDTRDVETVLCMGLRPVPGVCGFLIIWVMLSFNTIVMHLSSYDVLGICDRGLQQQLCV